MARMGGGRVRIAAMILVGVTATLAAVPARAQGGVAAAATAVAYAESPADALARNMRILATQPQDFNALIGAGRAALALDDTQSAAGFFGRAQERWPSSPLPMAGMGAALVTGGDATGALTYFQRAEALGASALTFAADRGLAYDLLGRHAEAQADYRTALMGQDRDEARRRLALSLAISGRREEALTMLGPLMARGDAGAGRCRALILALTGDTEGAKRTMETAMPGSSAMMGPFFRRLPALSTPQRAAAVNLGIFPDAAQIAYAAAAPSPTGTMLGTLTASATTNPVTGDRLTGIEDLLSGRAVSKPDVPPTSYQTPAPSPVQMASIPQRLQSSTLTTRKEPPAHASASSRFWVQLASGSDGQALPDEYRRLRQRKPEFFDDLNPYVAQESDRSRLLIGPFPSHRDAQNFAEALEIERIDAFSWTSRPGQPVRKISTE